MLLNRLNSFTKKAAHKAVAAQVFLFSFRIRVCRLSVIFSCCMSRECSALEF